MKQEKKAKRAEQKALEILAKYGHDTSKISSTRESISQESLEAEAVLAYWENGKEFKEKKCTHCKRKFATNYASVANCSDTCRKAELAAIGIDWSPFKTQHERWGRTPPLVVPQEALELIDQIHAESAAASDVPQNAVGVEPELNHQSTNGSHISLDFSLDELDLL